MRPIRLVISAALLAIGTVPALAQSNYPDRNIRLLFGFAPGVDTVARLLADKLGVALGKGGHCRERNRRQRPHCSGARRQGQS